MMESNIQTFQNYKKLFSQNKQISQSGRKRFNDQNTQNSLKNTMPQNTLPKKSQNIEKRANLQQQSPTRTQNSNRHRTCVNHSPVKSVSYGQLQVILQSIESIKAKARQQIQSLQESNRSLQRQIDCLNHKLKAINDLEKQLTEQHSQIRQKHLQTQKAYQQKTNQISQKQQIWIQQKDQYLHQIIEYRQALRIIQNKFSQMQYKYHQLQNDHSSLINKLTNNKPQRLPELVYQIGETFKGQSILDVVKMFQKEIVLLQNQNERVSFNVQALAQQLSQQKSLGKTSQQHITTLMLENGRLLQTLQIKQRSYQSQIQSIQQSLQKQKSLNTEIKSNHQLETRQLTRCIREKQQQFVEIQQQIQQLKQLIKQNQGQIKKQKEYNLIRDQQIQSNNIEKRFYDIVQEQCQDLQDVTKMLNKMEVLQKVKIQNRVNIEKIQFLCRMLDC